MAYVRKRGKRWYAEWTDETGQRRERALQARTKTEARDLAREIEAKAERVKLGLDVASVPMTFGELVTKHFLPVAKARRGTTKASLRAFGAMESRFRKHLLPRFGKMLLHQIRPSDLNQMSAELVEALAPQSRQHLKNHVSAAFTYAIEQMKIFRGENPGRQSEKEVIPENEPKFVPVNFIRPFLDAVPLQWRALFATSIYTGMRRGELFGLKVNDVDIEERVIRVRRSHDNPTTKGAKSRVVPIPTELLPYLAQEKNRSRSEWFFPRENGNQQTPDAKLSVIVRAALKRVGLIEGWEHRCLPRRVLVGKKPGAQRFTSEGVLTEMRGCGHITRLPSGEKTKCPRCGANMRAYAVAIPLAFKDLRSTYGTHATEATGDIRYVQRVLGHSDVRVTERTYASFANRKRLLEMADKVGGALAGLLPETADEKKQKEAKAAEVIPLKTLGGTTGC
jgi:integrase